MANSKWYIIHAYSGFEKKVADAIKERAASQGFTSYFEEVIVPTEEVIEIKKGKKVQSERKFFPGYVLVRMVMTDDTYHIVKNTPKVTGFLGSQNKPMPISDAEAGRILNQVEEGVERPRPLITFDIGEEVKIKDGPFNSFNGFVEEVDEDKARVKISVSIFGRATNVDLEFSQVEKI